MVWGLVRLMLLLAAGLAGRRGRAGPGRKQPASVFVHRCRLIAGAARLRIGGLSLSGSFRILLQTR